VGELEGFLAGGFSLSTMRWRVLGGADFKNLVKDL